MAMSRNDALWLLKRYAAFMRRNGHGDDTLTEIDRRFPPDGSSDKAMRWLGFMQGALYALGVFDLDQIIEHATLLTEQDLEALEEML